MRTADKVYAELDGRITEAILIEKLKTYEGETQSMIMGDTKDFFVIIYKDGSCNKFTFGQDTVKVEVGEDMTFVPIGTKLS